MCKEVCSRVLIIHRGQLVADDHTDNLSQSGTSNTHIRLVVKRPPQDALEHLRALPTIATARQDDTPSTHNEYRLCWTPAKTTARSARGHCPNVCAKRLGSRGTTTQAHQPGGFVPASHDSRPALTTWHPLVSSPGKSSRATLHRGRPMC
jgi:ABC-type multidrug transport system ATPase subunit